MKSNLTKVSFALLSAVFILGCQDVGTGVVAADELAPQFAKEKKGKPDNTGGGGGVKGTVSLDDGMMTTTGPLALPGKIDANTVTLNANNFGGTIEVDFDAGQDCDVIVGENGNNGVDFPEMDFLQAQLDGTVFTDGWFFLEVDKTSLTMGDPAPGNHLLNVGHYDELPDEFGSHTVSIDIRLWPPLSGVEGVEVEWVSPNVFEFTGPVWVTAGGVGGRKGKRGRRAIACAGDNSVTVTAVPVD